MKALIWNAKGFNDFTLRKFLIFNLNCQRLKTNRCLELSNEIANSHFFPYFSFFSQPLMVFQTLAFFFSFVPFYDSLIVLPNGAFILCAP